MFARPQQNNINSAPSPEHPCSGTALICSGERKKVGADISLINHPYVLKQKKTPTKAERRFLKFLKAIFKEYFPNYHSWIKTQVPLRHNRGFYILDFLIENINLAFEIDGGYHWRDKQIDKDIQRDEYLNSKYSIFVKHIGNRDVVSNGKRKDVLRNDITLLIQNKIDEKMEYDKKHFRGKFARQLKSVRHCNSCGGFMECYPDCIKKKFS